MLRGTSMLISAGQLEEKPPQASAEIDPDGGLNSSGCPSLILYVPDLSWVLQVTGIQGGQQGSDWGVLWPSLM